MSSVLCFINGGIMQWEGASQWAWPGCCPEESLPYHSSVQREGYWRKGKGLVKRGWGETERRGEQRDLQSIWKREAKSQ